MNIKRIVIHHTGSQATYEQLYNYWKLSDKDTPYHYLIDYDGKMIKGRQDFYKGAHLKGKNTGSLGIALLGDYSYTNPDTNMLYHMDNLIWYLLSEYPEIKEVEPHNTYSETICPGLYITAVFFAPATSGRSPAAADSVCLCHPPKNAPFAPRRGSPARCSARKSPNSGRWPSR